MVESLKSYFEPGDSCLNFDYSEYHANKKCTPISSNTREILERNVCDIVRLLNERGLSVFLCFGTLLGAIREGRVISWDHDADIGLLASDVELLISNLPNLNDFGFDLLRVEDDYLSMVREGEYVDLHVFRPDENNNFQSSGYKLPQKFLEPIVWVLAMGSSVPVPQKSESLLRFWYGKTWRKPIKGHHVIQNPNIMKFIRQWLRNKSLNEVGQPSGFLYRIYKFFRQN